MMSHSHSHTSWVPHATPPTSTSTFPCSLLFYPGACQEIPGECHHPGVTPFKLHAPATPWEGFFCISPSPPWTVFLTAYPSARPAKCHSTWQPSVAKFVFGSPRTTRPWQAWSHSFALGGDMLTSLLQGSQHRSTRNFRPIHRPNY
jgi:hypothetical protein